MKTTILLADSAQADQLGKAHALGLGWSVTTSPTPPMALVLLFEVDWNEANIRHHITVELNDSDGRPVLLPGAGSPLRFEADIEVGRPVGTPEGSPLGLPMAINIGPGLELTPGQRYRWVVTNTGQPDADLSVGFAVQAAG